MAAGYGFVHYPQAPGPTSAQVGSAAEAQAMAAHAAQMAAVARTTPGYLPYTGIPGGVGQALQPGPAPQAMVTPAPMPAPSGPAPAGVGAALMQRKAGHAAHLTSLGMHPADVAAQTGGPNG